jgi:hypothetical protein
MLYLHTLKKTKRNSTNWKIHIKKNHAKQIRLVESNVKIRKRKTRENYHPN